LTRNVVWKSTEPFAAAVKKERDRGLHHPKKSDIRQYGAFALLVVVVVVVVPGFAASPAAPVPDPMRLAS